MSEVYRAPMRSRDDAVPLDAGVRRALELGVCGLGERRHDERMERRLARFAAVSDGAVVWTVGPDGRFHTGVLDGPVRYDGSREALAADLVHVRDCTWEPVAEAEVPAAVRESFARGGRNFQRIRAAG